MSHQQPQQPPGAAWGGAGGRFRLLRWCGRGGGQKDPGHLEGAGGGPRLQRAVVVDGGYGWLWMVVVDGGY